MNYLVFFFNINKISVQVELNCNYDKTNNDNQKKILYHRDIVFLLIFSILLITIYMIYLFILLYQIDFNMKYLKKNTIF